MRKQDNFDTTERAVIALIEHRSLNKAAAALAVHPVTLWRWLKMPHFREQLREAQHQLFSRELARLQGLASAAVDALEEMLKFPGDTAEHAPTRGEVRPGAIPATLRYRGN